jgi:hypothetical protein
MLYEFTRTTVYGRKGHTVNLNPSAGTTLALIRAGLIVPFIEAPTPAVETKIVKPRSTKAKKDASADE